MKAPYCKVYTNLKTTSWNFRNNPLSSHSLSLSLSEIIHITHNHSVLPSLYLGRQMLFFFFGS